MERKYTILAILLIVLALGLLILPKKSEQKEIAPKELLSSVVGKSRYLTVDMVTHRIIENDPTLLLIDLRPADQFKTFALPGAINIQPETLLSKSNLEILNQPGKDKVLYSNADLSSEKAWLLCSRTSVNRMYIMKGGLNEWYNTFIKEPVVNATASSAELDALPGIGPTTAQKIIDYRTQNGPFASKEDIINVSGIGPGTYEKLKDLITVGP